MHGERFRNNNKKKKENQNKKIWNKLGVNIILGGVLLIFHLYVIRYILRGNNNFEWNGHIKKFLEYLKS